MAGRMERTIKSGRKFELPPEDMEAKIRNSLVTPKVALDLLFKYYKGERIPKDFIRTASECIDEAARLSKCYGKRR